MKNHFKPNVDHISDLQKAADQLENMLAPFFDNSRFKGAVLIVSNPDGEMPEDREERDVLTDEWHQHYYRKGRSTGRAMQDFEMKLVVTSSRKYIKTVIKKVCCKVRLTQLPGCCGACVITKLEVHPEARGNGIGRAFVRVLEAFIKALDYSLIMCTVEKFNCPAKKLVEGLGFTKSDKFINARTTNTIVVYMKNINPEGVSLTDGYDKNVHPTLGEDE